MSFICGICRKPAPAGTRCTLIKTAIKQVVHPFRGAAQKAKAEDGKTMFIADEGGRGTQTVKEVKACVNCAPSAEASVPATAGT